MTNVSDKSRRKNYYKYFMLNNPFFENRAVYELYEKNMVEAGSP